MKIATVLSTATPATSAALNLQPFPPLEHEARSHVETACAAFHMNRRPQTLRAWACLENGALRPVRINGRLAWSVAKIKEILNGG